MTKLDDAARIKRFEDLIAWQKARELTRAVYKVSQQGSFARDFGLSGQIQRAAVSIMSNISEGYERDSRREFYRFLSIAKVSCAEVRSQLYIAVDNSYISREQFELILAQAEEVGRVIGGLRVSVMEAELKEREEQKNNS